MLSGFLVAFQMDSIYVIVGIPYTNHPQFARMAIRERFNCELKILVNSMLRIRSEPAFSIGIAPARANLNVKNHQGADRVNFVYWPV